MIGVSTLFQSMSCLPTIVIFWHCPQSTFMRGTLHDMHVHTNTMGMSRDPWVLPIDPNARRAATAAKQALSDGAGGCSDHLALVRAYNTWSAEKARGREYAYAAATYISGGTMCMIEGMRAQLLGELTVR